MRLDQRIDLAQDAIILVHSDGDALVVSDVLHRPSSAGEYSKVSSLKLYSSSGQSSSSLR